MPTTGCCICLQGYLAKATSALLCTVWLRLLLFRWQWREFDLVRGHDLLADDTWLPLLRRVKNGDFTQVFLSPPCETYSRAPWANGNGPAPLRSADWPEGFPWLKGDDKRKVQQGTEIVRRCLHMVTVAQENGVLWLWEHPEDLGPTPRGTPAFRVELAGVALSF